MPEISQGSPVDGSSLKAGLARGILKPLRFSEDAFFNVY
jgi:hypothetical protein